MAWVFCPHQQGSIDLAGRRLGMRVDDVGPCGDVPVQAEHVEDQGHVAAALASADVVRIVPEIAGRRDGRADLILDAEPRRGPARQEKVPPLHAVDLGQVGFQMPLPDAVMRQVKHGQGRFGLLRTRRGGGMLAVLHIFSCCRSPMAGLHLVPTNEIKGGDWN